MCRGCARASGEKRTPSDRSSDRSCTERIGMHSNGREGLTAKGNGSGSIGTADYVFVNRRSAVRVCPSAQSRSRANLRKDPRPRRPAGGLRLRASAGNRSPLRCAPEGALATRMLTAQAGEFVRQRRAKTASATQRAPPTGCWGGVPFASRSLYLVERARAEDCEDGRKRSDSCAARRARAQGLTRGPAATASARPCQPPEPLGRSRSIFSPVQRLMRRSLSTTRTGLG